MIDPITQYILNEQQIRTTVSENLATWLNQKMGTNANDKSFQELISQPELERVAKEIDNKRAGIAPKTISVADRIKAAKEAGYRAGHSRGLDQGTRETIAATVVILIVVAFGYAVYKRFLSRAARACNYEKGNAKTLCMAQYRVKALEAKARVLTTNSQHCRNSSNPSKCKAELEQKVNHTNNEVRKIHTKMKELKKK